MHPIKTPSAWCAGLLRGCLSSIMQLDSIAGIGLGVWMRQVQGWSPEEQAPIAQAAHCILTIPYLTASLLI
ncbi:hypothetical protein [Candidatus Protochlamydia phocaeensis]|uniref:hypothetical protein n=1 Tax=Candidatus Protochlamydia phocaeensis TaxID=1414722 RepID=UPI000AB16BB0|nr:hypothetical protein [Candidatus Protochlamydia phocaeensis]